MGTIDATRDTVTLSQRGREVLSDWFVGDAFLNAEEVGGRGSEGEGSKGPGRAWGKQERVSRPRGWG